MRILAVLFIGAAVVFHGIVQLVGHQPQPPPISGSPTIEKLQSLQELAVQRVTVADVMTHEGGWRASWLIRGDGLISVPLNTARICDVDLVKRTARIVLEPPRVLTTRVDHDRTRYWDGRQGFWNAINPWGETLPEVSAQAMRGAQRLVHEAVQSPAILAQARASAATVIQALYRGLDWSVTVEWTDSVSTLDPTDRRNK